jgi:hypothetical protein
MIKHQHTPSALASLNRAHQPGCPGTNNDHIKIKSHKT